MFGSLLAVAAMGSLVFGLAPRTQDQSVAPNKPASIYDFVVKDIDGKDVKLSKYEGGVLLIVNVASK